MAAKTGVFNRASGATMSALAKAPHIGARAYVAPVDGDFAYGSWLYHQGYHISACTTDDMTKGYLDAERKGK